MTGCAAGRSSAPGSPPQGQTSQQAAAQTMSGGQNLPSGESVSLDQSTGVAKRVIYFDFDSAEVRPESRPVIEAHARYLLEHPNIVTLLEGHTDAQGSREYNVALGGRRAEAIRRLMGAYGVVPQQLHTLSYGEERPAVAGQDEASYAQNRRVEIVY